jgi:two-component system cell cycle response regulator DivK
MARILVVEDNRLNMELVTDLLEVAGHVVRQATSAEEGIAKAFADPPDLILLDIRMPGMSGLDAVRALKGHQATRCVPTVALTAQAMKGDEQVALDAGFDSYLPKPIDTRRFPREVERLLHMDVCR